MRETFHFHFSSFMFHTPCSNSCRRIQIPSLIFSAYVVVNFLSQLIFIFPLFWGMVMYVNEF